MTLTSAQWQQITNITQWMWAGGSSSIGNTAALQWTIADQMGQDVWAQINNAGIWDNLIGGVGWWSQAGYVGQDIAVQIQNQLAPIVTPDAPASTEPGLSPEDRSAKASLTAFLEQYGLETLGDFVWQSYLNGVPLEQIMLDVRDRPEYAARFPAMKTLGEKGHAMSEAEYIGYEKQVTGLAQAVGFPPGMFDQPEDFKALLENSLSVQEVAQRLQDWVSFADTAPEINKVEMQRLYGVGTGALAAYFMNPEKALPLLEKQAASALTGVSSIQSGYGELSQEHAEYVAGLGHKPEATREGFGNLVTTSELFNPLDMGEDAISRDQQLQAMFGANAEAQGAIGRRAARRGAYFEQGGQFTSNKEGFSGAGSAR